MLRVYDRGWAVLVWMALVSAPVALLAQDTGGGQPSSNDHIFPAAPQAKPFIDFDGRGFLINGHRTFLVSAGMEYARVPHELWGDRLLRLRRAGFNCVEIYTFWNFHEPRQGVFDFSGDHDLDAFLRLVRKMGMYAIVRVGPYYCAEWDNGGYPLWLRFLPGVKVREPNAVFEKYTGLFFDRLIPIVAANQVNHGGAVILVQLENEHPDGWGTVMPNSYFRYLRDKALSLGLEVPYFFSGLHHANDPAGESRAAAMEGGDAASLDDAGRPNPWFSTEFWSVWYDGYGSGEKEAKLYERRTWKIIAHGGNGYNYYMAHGGSNFGYTNNDEDAASYDYGAAVGQGGDLRPIYYIFKRTALFARSFQSVLENSVDGTAAYGGIVKQVGVRDTMMHDAIMRVSVRKSPAGDILFLDNPSERPVEAVVGTAPGVGWLADTLTLAPGEILPLVRNYQLAPGIELVRSAARILAISREGHMVTLLAYGEAGSRVRYYFSVKGRRVKLDARVPVGGRAAEYGFVAGAYRLRVLVMSRALADRTWVIGERGKSYIVSGPDYAGEIKIRDGHISLWTERSGGVPDPSPVWVYTEGGVRRLEGGGGRVNVVKTLPVGGWERKDGMEEAKPDYDDRDWKYSDIPLQMGADGDGTADAWYRVKAEVDTPGVYTLRVEGSDRATAFVDGKAMGPFSIKDGEIPFTLSKGRHVLAIFMAHDGRDKLPAYIGPIDSADRKGLFGKALLMKGGPSVRTLEGWRVMQAAVAGDVYSAPPSDTAAGWRPYTIGQDVFDRKQGFGWFQVRLPDPPAGATQIEIHFASVDENATVFVGGRRMTRHEGWNVPFNVLVDRVDSLPRPIWLTLFVENYSNEGGIDKPVRAGPVLSPVAITEWRMRGGTGDTVSGGVWGAVGAAKAKAGASGPDSGRLSGPCWWRTGFNLPADASAGTVWRVIPKGLGHGSVWVNGHNLGRYPEKIPIDGLYIPGCWMQPGKNTLLIFDEDGKDARQVGIEAEIPASRRVELLNGR